MGGGGRKGGIEEGGRGDEGGRRGRGASVWEQMVQALSMYRSNRCVRSQHDQYTLGFMQILRGGEVLTQGGAEKGVD